MNYELTADDLNKLSLLDAEQRYALLHSGRGRSGKDWILVDEEGFVLVDADEERCIPVWPHAELAELWINGDWAQSSGSGC